MSTDRCDNRWGPFTCTRDPGHEGEHQGGDNSHRVARWSRRGRVELDLAVLARLLHLPAGTRIVRTQSSDFRDTVQLLLEGDGLDNVNVAEGEEIPLYTLTYREPVAEFVKRGRWDKPRKVQPRARGL